MSKSRLRMDGKSSKRLFEGGAGCDSPDSSRAPAQPDGRSILPVAPDGPLVIVRIGTAPDATRGSKSPKIASNGRRPAPSGNPPYVARGAGPEGGPGGGNSKRRVG